mmetsp:Transcript_21804/g.53442  ORF Transcript_21804/g.53442 Transcript_21804/m.53442 type:complete len:135 (-) Transcript_21804:318-722(-)
MDSIKDYGSRQSSHDGDISIKDSHVSVSVSASQAAIHTLSGQHIVCLQDPHPIQRHIICASVRQRIAAVSAGFADMATAATHRQTDRAAARHEQEHEQTHQHTYTTQDRQADIDLQRASEKERDSAAAKEEWGQ